MKAVLEGRPLLHRQLAFACMKRLGWIRIQPGLFASGALLLPLAALPHLRAGCGGGVVGLRRFGRSSGRGLVVAVPLAISVPLVSVFTATYLDFLR